VHDLKVSGQAFEGTSVDGSFLLKDATLQKIPPLAFNFDQVGNTIGRLPNGAILNKAF
jgi:hypothetical protein